MAGDVLTAIAVDITKALTTSFVSLLLLRLLSDLPSFTPLSLQLFLLGANALLMLVFCDTIFERKQFYCAVGVIYLAIWGKSLL